MHMRLHIPCLPSAVQLVVRIFVISRHLLEQAGLVPHGNRPTKTNKPPRGMMQIDLRNEDFFRRVVEERKKFPKDDPM